MQNKAEQLQYHAAADVFAMMDNSRYNELLADIKKNGQRVPIVTCNGLILDGRNRYKACLELNIEPVIESFNGNPWAYVWSLNGARRDLDGLQRAIIYHKCMANSDDWQAKQKEITDAGNTKRAEAASGNSNAVKTVVVTCEPPLFIATVNEPVLSETMVVPEEQIPKTTLTTHPGRAARAIAKEEAYATQTEQSEQNPPDGFM